MAGWPVDACDVLLLDPASSAEGAADRREATSAWVQRARFLRPRTVLVNEDDQDCLQRSRAALGQYAQVQAVAWNTEADRDDLVRRLVGALPRPAP